MNKLLLLLALSFLSVQSFAGSCPDGSDPVKSVSEDGSYFVYNCATGSLEPGELPFSHSLWTAENGYNEIIGPHWTTYLRNNYNDGWQQVHLTDDMNGDGIIDFVYFPMFNIENPNGSGTISNDDLSDAEHGLCTDEVCVGFSVQPAIYFGRSDGTWILGTGAIIDNRKKSGYRWCRTPKLADFNGDGRMDMVLAVSNVGDIGHYNYGGVVLLTNTGEGIFTPEFISKKTFTHGHNIGDLDGDGDIDIVVPSNRWVGHNGEILCYVNQGDGHMKVRICGDQHAWRAELGDIDNDGDLDIVIGGNSLASKKEWADVDGMGACRGQASCPVAFDGILLNDGTGNFFQRGFSFPDDVKNNGFTYHSVPTLSVADLDGDGDLDVVRSLIGRNYAGMAMSIEENIGNGQFRTVFLDEWCEGPSTKAEWPAHEGNKWGCWAPGWMFGDFNKDGFVDIVVDGQMNVNDKGLRIIDGTVYLSTGKFTYDIIRPDEENYPLADFGVTFTYRAKTKETETSIKFESSIKKNGMVVFESADKCTKFDIGISLNNSGALLVGFKDLKAVDDKQAKVRLHIKYGNIDFSVGVCFEYYPQNTFMAARTSFNKNDWGGLKKIMPSSRCIGIWELKDNNKSKLQELGIFAVMEDIQENAFQILEALDNNSTIDLSEMRSFIK